MPGKIEEVKKLAEVNNLLNIYSGFSEIEKHKLVEQYEGKNGVAQDYCVYFFKQKYINY